MTTQYTAQVDKLLTDVSQMIVPKGYISEMILPSKSVVQYSGLIGKYGNEHLRIVNAAAGGRSSYRRVETIQRSSDTYHLQDHALEQLVTREDFRNVEKPFDARRDVTTQLTAMLWTEKEKLLADTLTDTAVITNNVTLAGTDQYNDYTNSTPLEDFVTARQTVRANTGCYPNKVALGPVVFDTLRYHPAMLDALGYKEARPGGLSVEEMARALDVDKVLVGQAVYNNSNFGAADSIEDIWGKHMVWMCSPDAPGLMQKTLGYRVQLSGASPRQVYKFLQDTPIGSELIVTIDTYEQLITDATSAYLIKNAVA